MIQESIWFAQNQLGGIHPSETQLEHVAESAGLEKEIAEANTDSAGCQKQSVNKQSQSGTIRGGPKKFCRLRQVASDGCTSKDADSMGSGEVNFSGDAAAAHNDCADVPRTSSISAILAGKSPDQCKRPPKGSCYPSDDKHDHDLFQDLESSGVSTSTCLRPSLPSKTRQKGKLRDSSSLKTAAETGKEHDCYEIQPRRPKSEVHKLPNPPSGKAHYLCSFLETLKSSKYQGKTLCDKPVADHDTGSIKITYDVTQTGQKNLILVLDADDKPNFSVSSPEDRVTTTFIADPIFKKNLDKKMFERGHNHGGSSSWSDDDDDEDGTEDVCCEQRADHNGGVMFLESWFLKDLGEIGGDFRTQHVQMSSPIAKNCNLDQVNGDRDADNDRNTSGDRMSKECEDGDQTFVESSLDDKMESSPTTVRYSWLPFRWGRR
jgi:hypothetical protein